MNGLDATVTVSEASGLGAIRSFRFSDTATVASIPFIPEWLARWKTQSSTAKWNRLGGRIHCTDLKIHHRQTLDPFRASEGAATIYSTCHLVLLAHSSRVLQVLACVYIGVCRQTSVNRQKP